MGGFVSPQVQAMQLESGRERLGRDQAQAQREGQYDVNKLNYARDVAVAGQSAPVFAQTGSTGTQKGKTVQSESPLGEITKFAASAAPVSL